MSQKNSFVQSLSQQTRLPCSFVADAVSRTSRGQAVVWPHREEKAKIESAIAETLFKEVTLPNRDNHPTKYYIVEGDLRLNETQFQEYMARKKAETELKKQLEENPTLAANATVASLLGQMKNGKLIRWSAPVANNLTWWLNEKSFHGSGIDFKEVAGLMYAASSDWERVCGVNFNEVSDPDSALFHVVYTEISEKNVIAMAFFPDAPKTDRLLHIYPGWRDATDNATGILRHELGHVLGFRHEHIRLAAIPPQYRESTDNTVPLTVYDNKSVMHYNFQDIGLGGTSELLISRLDEVGARSYYGGSFKLFADIPN